MLSLFQTHLVCAWCEAVKQKAVVWSSLDLLPESECWCVFVCVVHLFMSVWWHFFSSMLKWPQNVLFEDIRLETLQKAFHRSKHHAGKKNVFKIKKDFPGGWWSKMLGLNVQHIYLIIKKWVNFKSKWSNSLGT